MPPFWRPMLACCQVCVGIVPNSRARLLRCAKLRKLASEELTNMWYVAIGMCYEFECWNQHKKTTKQSVLSSLSFYPPVRFHQSFITFFFLQFTIYSSIWQHHAHESLPPLPPISHPLHRWPRRGKNCVFWGALAVTQACLGGAGSCGWQLEPLIVISVSDLRRGVFSACFDVRFGVRLVYKAETWQMSATVVKHVN